MLLSNLGISTVFGVVRDFDRKVVENPLVNAEEGYKVDFDHFENYVQTRQIHFSSSVIPITL